MRSLVGLGAVLMAATAACAQEAAPWSTYRGNPQRTGHADKQPGPHKPNVLWVMKTKENYIASPVPAGNRLLVSGLGAFNVAGLSCLSVEPKTSNRLLWSKTTPLLKLPTVSSPALAGGRMVFGDGMHQTDGAALHCLDVDKGMPIWQLFVPGKLVHLESAPTIAGGKVYIGGGAAGVLCVDLEKVTLEGKEMDLPTVQKILALKWKELLAKYEVDKKKDPDFAVPPSEDQLAKAQPKLLWQQGKGKWHVDAPLLIAGDHVLVGSAFLDKEQEGDRALYCLDAKSGAIRWRTPLTLNPWGGPALAGDTIILTGSAIGYDPASIKKTNKGIIAAYSLADGKEKWSKPVKGGVVGCAALAHGSALITATDGVVRAFDIATGERRWLYETKAPCFAPVAVAGTVVYAGDLAGKVHAIDAKSGAALWTLDLGSHKEVASPGMIYAGPVVADGRLYVLTCNLEGPSARQPTVVVCIGDR